MGAVARSAHQAGVPLRGPAEIADGRGLSAFLTNELWRSRLGYNDLPIVSEEKAGALLAELADGYDFVLFETYMTDIVGHRGDLHEAVDVLERLDSFVTGVLSKRAPELTVVLSSDHGNIEDMSTKRHTLNGALSGWLGPTSAPDWNTILDVTPAIVDTLEASAMTG